MLRLIDPVPCEESEFIWNFAYSENHSRSRHGDAWRSRLGTRLQGLLDQGARLQLTPHDWETLREVLMAVRGMYVGGLIRLRPDWYLGSLQSSSLGELRLIAHEPFREIAPSLRLDDFVRALDAGRETPGDRFAQRYRQLRPTFDPAKVRGRPMLAGKALAGPFIEIDGLTRVSILWSRHLKNDSLPQRIEVVAGISPRIEEWPYACADGHVPVEWASPARY